MRTITARQRVLALIGRRNAASAAQIAEALNMSAATVRHHLAILAADERVVVRGLQQRRKRGRPENVYGLSDRVLGDNLGALADISLKGWLGRLTEAKRDVVVGLLADGIKAQVGTMDDTLSAPKRIVQFTDRLNELHYKARWEAGAAGPRLLFGHCPYAAIINRHPELCEVDAALLRGVLGGDVDQLAKIDTKPGGPPQCIFAVRGQATSGTSAGK